MESQGRSFAILACNTRKSWWKQHGGLFFNIQPTFLHDFLLPKEEATLLRTIGRGICTFFSIICIFSRRKLANVAHYFEHTVPLVNSIHDIWDTYLFVSSKRAHIFDRPPIEERKQIASTVWALADQGTCRTCRSMSDCKLLAFRAGPREQSGPTS